MRILRPIIGSVMAALFVITLYVNYKSDCAYTAMKALDYPAAKTELEAIEPWLPFISWSTPGSADAMHFNLATTLTNLGEIESAQKEIELAKDSPDYLLLKGQISCATGKLQDAINYYNEFMVKQPNGEHAQDCREQLALLTPELQKQKPLLHKSPVNAEDYLPFVTEQHIFKWKKSRFPLTVYIPRDSESATVTGYRPPFAKRLRAAFEEWQSKAHELVSFKFVDKAAGCDIDCRWVDNASKLHQKAEGGDARLTADNVNGIRHSEITILTHRLDANGTTPIGAREIYNVALHEIGHSLGLMGHSPNPNDIMFFMEVAGSKIKSLSERDLKTLRHLYEPPTRATGNGNNHQVQNIPRAAGPDEIHSRRGTLIATRYLPKAIPEDWNVEDIFCRGRFVDFESNRFSTSCDHVA